nr:NADH dehydrogenase subunit 5 [Eucnemidae sp. GENSP01]
MSLCLIYFVLFLFLSILFFFFSIYFINSGMSYLLEFELLNFNSSEIYMSILLDWMSLLFMSFVLFISSMVIFYSEDYMSGDLTINRFILLVVMFVSSMMLLIISPNLISILLGWDGLGLVSYCLVIYYQNVKSFNAGMLTALSNRIGDVALLVSIAWMLNYGSWNYIYYLEFMKDDFYMILISLMVIIASMTKSAQIPFSSWLPAAMAAPTPVSSLVHSSTLVTAGVYLLIRFNFSLNTWMLSFLLFISLMTMFMAGLGANFEYDLKKIIALSTLSQLGLMLTILSMGDYILSFFHLLIHALFKALLFMCAGVIIHSLSNCQDIRFMGCLLNQFPLTCCFFNICNLALCGLPFMSGFYSKDMILEFMSFNYMNFFVYLVFYLSIGLTVMYSVRLSYYSLFNNFNFLKFYLLGDMSFIMMKGMSGLIFFVVFSGSLMSWLILPSPYFFCLPLFMKMLVLIMIFMGIWMGYEFSLSKFHYVNKSLNYFLISMFSGSMWNMPFISTYIIKYPLLLGGLIYQILDNGWSEYLGSQQIFNKLMVNSMKFSIFFNNSLKIFLTILIVWLLILLF